MWSLKLNVLCRVIHLWLPLAVFKYVKGFYKLRCELCVVDSNIEFVVFSFRHSVYI